MSDVSSKHGSNTIEPVKDGRPWNPALTIGIVLVLFLVPQIIAGVIVGAAAQDSAGLLADVIIKQFIFVFIAEALTLGGLLAVLRLKGQGFRSLGLTRPKQIDLFYAFVGFAGYFVLNIILVGVLTQIIPGLNIDQKQDIGFDTAKSIISLVPVFVALVILAPLAEEILVRGFLFGNLRKYMGLMWAVISTSIIFGAAHLLGGEPGAPLLWVAAIDTFALSVVLCYLRERTGRLWAGISLHALKNLIAFLAIFVFHISK